MLVDALPHSIGQSTIAVECSLNGPVLAREAAIAATSARRGAGLRRSLGLLLRALALDFLVRFGEVLEGVGGQRSSSALRLVEDSLTCELGQVAIAADQGARVARSGKVMLLRLETELGEELLGLAYAGRGAWSLSGE